MRTLIRFAAIAAWTAFLWTAAPAVILVNPINPANGGFIPCVDMGDVNGDGVDDLIASCPSSGSQTYLVAYSGKDGSELYRTGAPPNYWTYGRALQPLGNYGGLPTPDFAATSIAGTSTDGAVFIVEGATGEVIDSILAPAIQTNGDFGESLFLADLTGDPTPDFVVGAPQGGTNGGRIYIYDGATKALADTIEPPSAQAGQRFSAYSLLPDLDNDGVEEIGAAAPYRDVSGQTWAGEAYIFSGASRSLFRTITLASPQQDDRLEGPYPLGDLNGDSKTEYACAYGTTAARATLVIFSGIDGSVLDSIPAPDSNAADWGRSVVGIDNITTDSVNEIVVGTRSSGTDTKGTVYVYNGATRALVTSFGRPSEGAYFGGSFGEGLHLVGDVDNDGKQDVAIPAIYEGNGTLYIFTYGGSPGFRSPPFDVGEYRIGSTPAEATRKVFNLGFSDLNLTTTAIGGADAGDFSLTSDVTPVTVAAAQSATFGISPAATTKGYKSGTFSVQGDNGSTTTIALTEEAYERPSGPDTQLAYLAAEDRVMLVDVLSGERDIISGRGVGGGDPFPFSMYGPTRVTDVLIEDANNLIVSAGFQLLRVDRTTGDRTALNAAPVADGVQDLGDQIIAMDWESPGVLLALIDGINSRVTRVTLAGMTGQVVSGAGVGTGPVFSTYGSDLLVKPDGDILLMDFAGQSLLEINPSTGDRVKLNAAPLPYPVSMTLLNTAEVALAQFSYQYRVLRYNFVTDTLSLIADPGYFYATNFNAMQLLDDGNLTVYVGNLNSLLYVDVATGDVTTVATPTLGLGPTLPMADYYQGGGMRILAPTTIPSGISDWEWF